MNRQVRRPRRAEIGLESLEGRAVLSTVTAMIAPLPGALAHGITYLDVQGSAQGTPTEIVGDPDVGTTVMLHGTGNVPGLGAVKVSGAIHGTGFYASSHVEGTITLSNHKTSVTLNVQSPTAGGFTAPASGTYQFTIRKGTGSQAHAFGFGTVGVVLGSNSFKLTFQGKPDVY